MERFADKTKLTDWLRKLDALEDRVENWELIAELYDKSQDEKAKRSYFDWLIEHSFFSEEGFARLLEREPDLINNERYIIKFLFLERNEFKDAEDIVNKITNQATLLSIALNACHRNVSEKWTKVGVAAVEKITEGPTLQKFNKKAKQACEKGEHFWQLISSEDSSNWGTTDNYVTSSSRSTYKCRFCDKESTSVSYW